MSRRRLTWNGRTASAPPAMPGYQEPSIHPAAYPDPEADAYENGDTSSWAEDPHPGPYPNSFHPALPGTEEPMGHPATDPAHYFPAGVTKQASRQLRAAMEAKAAKCIRIAQSMLGKSASVSAVEDQALDLMNLTERQIQAALKRIAEDGMAQDVPTEASADLLAVDNYTLTPSRTSDEALLASMMAEEHGAGHDADEALLASMMAEEHGAGHDADEALLASMMAEEAPKAGKMSEEAKAEALLSSMMAEEAPKAGKMSGKLSEQIASLVAEQVASIMAGRKASSKRAFGVYDKMPGDQNDPAHYNFRAEGVLASAKKSEEKAEEAPKAEEETKAEETAAKKAAHYQRLAAHYARIAKKSEETKAEEAVAEEEPKEEPKAGKKAGMTADIKAAIAELLAEETAPVAGMVAEEFAEEDPMADDLMGDLMGDEAPVADDLMALYSMKLAGKKSEEAEEADEATAEEADEVEAEEAADEEPKAGKKAAVRPQARKASNGVRTLGAVSKVASSDVNDLSKLWESAPDVSKVFG